MLHFLTTLSSEWNTITVHREANYPLSIKPSITDLLTAGNKSQTPLQIALKYMFIHWRKMGSTAHTFMKFYSQKWLPSPRQLSLHCSFGFSSFLTKGLHISNCFCILSSASTWNYAQKTWQFLPKCLFKVAFLYSFTEKVQVLTKLCIC